MLNNMRRRFMAGTIAAVLATTMAGCGSSAGSAQSTSASASAGQVSSSAAGAEGKTLRVGVDNLISTTLDPAKDSAGTGFSRAGIGQSLMICNTKGELVPWLAESITSDDDIHWTVKLPEGIKFSNGNPCDAKAVQDSLQYLMDNNAGLAKSLNIASMEVGDSTTLNITTNDVTSDFLSYLSHPQACIQDVSVEDKDNAPVGTGPYKVDKFISEQEIDESANENYASGTPGFDSVIYYMSHDSDAMWLQLQSGDIDMVVSPSSENIASIDGSDTYELVTSDLTARDRYVLYNLEGKYTSNVNFRKGVDHLIDRDTIVNSIMNNLAVKAEGCIPEGYDATPDYVGTSYDKDTALKYFEAAGLTVKDGKVTDNGSPITLQFHSYSSFPEMDTIVQLIQSSLSDVGIDAEVTSSEEDIDDWLGDTDNNSSWDISMASMFAVPRGDAAYILNTCFDVNSQYNYSTTRVPDDELQQMIDQIKTTTDTDARTELIKKAALRVEDQCYMSNYMNPTFNIVYNKKNIANVTAYASEQYFVNDAITPA